jgi:hypothetical protein
MGEVSMSAFNAGKKRLTLAEECSCRLCLRIENLSGFLQIGNTQRRTHETYPKPRKKLDEFIFEKKPR